MNKVLVELKERGFLQQCTDWDRLSDYLDNNKVSMYVGIDPTASSMHIGHIVPLFAMYHFQRFGHKPVILIGDGTATIGDPSGKTEMRKMLSMQEIQNNAKTIAKQVERIVDFSNGNAKMLFNSSWLLNLNYIEFLREIGKHFSVNRMLTFESYKQRLEKGLSFIEFNYQLLQSYDFLQLYKNENVHLQTGGDDQWGNIVAGIDLIRRIESGEDAFGLTYTLVTRSDGKKMGKSENGAVFLSKELYSPYDFYQYWRNVTDEDVYSFMKRFTFMDLDEIREYEKASSTTVNEAKARLAFEQTKIVHSEEEAIKAQEAAKALFSGSANSIGVPSFTMKLDDLKASLLVVDLFTQSGLTKSKSEARRLINQGGAYLNDQKIEDLDLMVNEKDLQEDYLMLRLGKKKFMKVIFS